MFVASIAEVVSIGAVVPFLGVLTNPQAVLDYPIVQQLVGYLDVRSSDQLLLVLTIAFVVASLGAGAMRLLLLWATTRLSFAMGADISFDIYRRTLSQTYRVHISRNSSEVINGIITKANSVIINVIVPLLFIISSLGLLLPILAVLIGIDPFVSLVFIFGFGLLYALIAFLNRKRLMMNSQHIASESTQVIKSIQEGLGGIRNILVDGTQEKFESEYRRADLKLRISQGDNIFIAQSPRFVMESLGMMLIGLLAYFMSVENGSLGSAVPLLGAMALGAQRSLPLLQRIYLGWSSVQGHLASLSDVLDLLDQPYSEGRNSQPTAAVPFEKNIMFENVSFRHAEDSDWIFENLQLEIRKGERLGLIGVTGSGKSTLIDILMGLLIADKGQIKVDGRVIDSSNVKAWQRHVAHVPQHIFLADSSIEENIAFGAPRDCIEHEKVRRAAEQAQLLDLIESWPEGFKTFVGERGVRLSGGQMQRIGIARALYKQADLIVLDEATSALDTETEAHVMRAIDSLSDSLTVVMIAHRLSTLKNCHRIIELCGKGIVREGSYREIVPAEVIS